MLKEFYKSHIQGKPYVITIYDDKRMIHLEKLKASGNLVVVKSGDFIVF